MYAAQSGGIFFAWNIVSLKDKPVLFVIQKYLVFGYYKIPGENMNIWTGLYWVKLEK